MKKQEKLKKKTFLPFMSLEVWQAYWKSADAWAGYTLFP